MSKNTGSSREVTAESLGIQSQSKIGWIHIFATLGAAFLIFTLYIWISWIVGPMFKEVDAGPSEPALSMRIWLVTLCTLCLTTFLICMYYLIIKPWRRERRIPLDGMLYIGFGLIVALDPWLNYINHWCTYNTWLFNMGNWIHEIPGWLSFGKPGALFAEPIGINVMGYMFGLLAFTWLGCWVLRRAKRIWPGISTLKLIGVCIVWALIWDFLFEEILFLWGGLYTYPGSIQALCIFPDTYFQYPIYEAIYGFVLVGFVCLRFFRNDRGETFVERGVEKINGFWKQQTARFLAIYAALFLLFFLIYDIPSSYIYATHTDPWPEDIQKRSYFMSGMFGEFTGILSPDPDLPYPQNKMSYVIVDEDGNYYLHMVDGTDFLLDKDAYDFPEIIPFADVPDDYPQTYATVTEDGEPIK